MKLKSALGLALLCLTFCSDASWADLHEWSVSSGGNGHFYDPVLVSAGIDWEGANAAATARGGYLATITSAEENAFVYSLVDDPAFWRDTGPVNGEGPFLGGYRLSYNPSNPAADWHWVTGEPWVYTNWVPIEPSGDQTQNRLHFFGYYSRQGPQWNDLPHVNYFENGYIVEFDQNPVPVPGAALLGMIGLGYSAMRLRRCSA
jgi:hypothetical protein